MKDVGSSHENKKESEPGKRRNTRARMFSVIRYMVLLAILIGAFFALKHFYDNRPMDVYDAPDLPVTVMKPVRMDISSTLEVTGYVEPDNIIPVVPFVSGTILEYCVEEGEHVEKDQVLARIDERPYEMQRVQAEAQYLALESSLKRVEELYRSGATTLQNLETIRAQHDAARAQLDLAELQLSYASVTSPVEGTVLQAPGSKGGIASQSQPVAVIADLDNLVVNVKIAEKYYQAVKDNYESLEVYVATVDGTCRSACTPVYISPMIDATSKNFTLKVQLEDCASFAPGMYVKVFVTYETQEDVYAIENSMVKLDGGVYRYDPETSTVSYEKLELGVENDSYVQVPEEEKDNYFVKLGINKVFDGQKVKVVEEE